MSNFDETLMKRLTKLEREVERLKVKESPIMSNYLLTTGKAADSDKLDGLDSTAFLQADSWANHTPTVTASSGTFTAVSSLNRYFTLHGKTRVLKGFVYITTKGTADGSVYVSIPSGAATMSVGGYLAVSAWGNGGGINALLDVTESRIEILKYDNTTAIADGALISYAAIYELE